MQGPPPSDASTSKGSTGNPPNSTLGTPNLSWHANFPTPNVNNYGSASTYPPPGNDHYPSTSHSYGLTYNASPVSMTSTRHDRDETSKSNDTTAPPELPCKHWEQAFKKFFVSVGFTQTLRSFEADFVVINSDWEEKRVPNALQELARDLQAVHTQTLPGDQEDQIDIMDVDGVTPNPAKDMDTLDERKLDHLHVSNGLRRRTPSSINKEISAFIARTRRRNDASNRAEFLYSLAEKKRTLAAFREDVGEDDDQFDSFASCARVDARPIDRDAQMKYDIAKNEGGPLTRTMQPKNFGINPSLLSFSTSAVRPMDALGGSSTSTSNGKTSKVLRNIPDSENSVTAARYPALDERLRNIEDHFAIRYVPSPPRTLLARLKYLEDHIIQLERDYPPWAALHFNQPNRGWPPPPRSTPIIVPPHLRPPEPSAKTSESTATHCTATPTESNGSISSTSLATSTGISASKQARGKSSLHKAVMERLEVQRAMSDLKTRSEDRRVGE